MPVFILQNKDKDLSIIGLVITMASIVMLFGTLISSFYVLKIRMMGQLTLPNIIIQLGIVNTVILLISSITFIFSENMFRKNRLNNYSFWLLMTIFGGFFFLIGQMYLWNKMTQLGIAITKGQLSDMFYLMSGAHGLHIIAGIVALIWLQSTSKKLTTNHRVNLVGIFWHFLGFLWFVLFAVILF